MLFVAWFLLVVLGYVVAWAFVEYIGGPGGGIVASLAFIALQFFAGVFAVSLFIFTNKFWRKKTLSRWAIWMGLSPPVLYFLAMAINGFYGA